jgi:hypothetical protein
MHDGKPWKQVVKHKAATKAKKRAAHAGYLASRRD